MQDYAAFLARKVHEGADHGFEPVFMPAQLFDFQQAMVDYAVRKGRAALFEDCGLGKTVQFLTWGQNVVEHTNRPVLVLTPLAVAGQTIREADKFGIEAVRWQAGRAPAARIVVAHYEQLKHLDPADYAGVVCDESSILKSFDGATRGAVIDFLRKVLFRLLATATAAPNDYVELGSSSEALGYMGYMDMLNRFFRNEQGNSTATGRMYGEAPKWRFKGHSELPFWRWVCSWARAMRKPSDLGFDDRLFALPPLREREHLVEAPRDHYDGLFHLPATTLREQREEKKRSIRIRCERAAALADHPEPTLLWCQLNEEGDALAEMIPGAVQVSGRDSDAAKEEKFLGFIDGQIRDLVIKPSIGALGLNFQHCAHVIDFPSHSFEQYYQGVRRCWRFGQQRAVVVDTVLTEGERRIIDNRKRKAAQAEAMFGNLIAEMNNAMAVSTAKSFDVAMEVPRWAA